jgi:uncharacterized protein YjiS (DUF1127 family)
METKMYRYNSGSSISLPRRRTGAIFGALLRAVDAMATWHDRRRQRFALARLDDRMLRDIGLTMADVEAEVSKPFWR